MKWRAGWTSIGFLVALIGIALWAAVHQSWTPGPLIIIAALAVSAYTLMFAAFRCPHCGARQLRDRYDWWLIGDRCRSCHQLLDGPARSEDELSEDLIAEEKPQLAAELRRERIEFESLIQRAPTDALAARQLEAELTRRIANMKAGLVDIGRLNPSDAKTLRSLQADLTKAEEQLAWCKSLLSGAEHSV